ncbi:hypothetical protein DFH06DRAFT_1366179 [Mycena polygramma]|nr:hypothetical protein DFH06DRAFT_1366179 [Mycena polygramma]
MGWTDNLALCASCLPSAVQNLSFLKLRSRRLAFCWRFQFFPGAFSWQLSVGVRRRTLTQVAIDGDMECVWLFYLTVDPETLRDSTTLAMPRSSTANSPVSFVTHFDLKVVPPPWAIKEVREMEVNVVSTSAYAGQALWQHLVMQSLREVAGVLPSSVLTDWRRKLIDHKSTLSAIADALGLQHPSDAVPHNELFVCVVRVIYRRDRGAALKFVRELIRPASESARDTNATRLRVVKVATHRPPGNTRQLEVLRALKAKNRLGITHLTQTENSPSLLASDGSGEPGSGSGVPSSQLKSPPASPKTPPRRKRSLPASPSSEAGPSRLPLGQISPLAAPQPRSVFTYVSSWL